MIGAGNATSALTLLVLLSGGLLRLSTSSPLAVTGGRGGGADSPQPPPGLTPTRGGGGGRREGAPPPRGSLGEEEEEDELFKDVDPRALAAVLLEALNKPAEERRRAGEGEVAEGRGKGEAEEAGAAEGADRDRDGRQELELAVAAAQGKEEREREEEEERRRKQEEEDKLTEKVTSRTSSHTIPAKTEQTSTATAGGGEEALEKEVGAREEAREKGPSSQEEAQQQEEEEEQLSPEEVKNLETMLEEFQSLSATSKRERQREMETEGEKERERERQSLVQRESRGYSPGLGQALPANDVNGKPKGHQLAMSKKKLKWQEETQKAFSFPTFRGGNFVDDFDNTAADQPPPTSPEDEGVDEEGEEEEEALSPEEEEARARAEQEEVRRQAAEAQRAKAEEEKMADIASDMLLQYMVKQDGGRGKYADKSRKKAPPISNGNAAEDKRSDEEAATTGDDGDDIDPQTIDKLIEISSRLHLPADDVVDIISDVEKKKKKDAPGGPEVGGSPWQRPLAANSANAVQSLPLPPRNPTPKQPPPPVNPLKAWFKENVPLKPTNQELWITKPAQSFRAPSSSSYAPYPSYQKTYRGYYPIYFPPPKPRYYAKPQTPLSLGDLLGNSLDYDLDFPPKRRYRPWVQPRPRKPPSAASLRRNLYLSDYVLPQRPRTFNPYLYPAPMPKPRSAPRAQGRRRPAYYYAPPGPLLTRDEDYYGRVGPRADSAEDLENFIQQLLRKRSRMFQ